MIFQQSVYTRYLESMVSQGKSCAGITQFIVKGIQVPVMIDIRQTGYSGLKIPGNRFNEKCTIILHWMTTVVLDCTQKIIQSAFTSLQLLKSALTLIRVDRN